MGLGNLLHRDWWGKKYDVGACVCYIWHPRHNHEHVLIFPMHDSNTLFYSQSYSNSATSKTLVLFLKCVYVRTYTRPFYRVSFECPRVHIKRDVSNWHWITITIILHKTWRNSICDKIIEKCTNLGYHLHYNFCLIYKFLTDQNWFFTVRIEDFFLKTCAICWVF